MFVGLIGLSQAQPTAEGSGVTVSQLAICRGIVDREPDGIDSVFDSAVERVYCYSKITGAEEEVMIEHIWYYNEEEVANVPLPVKAAVWRTYSSKKIDPAMTGDWMVKVMGQDGGVLREIVFEVK